MPTVFDKCNCAECPFAKDGKPVKPVAAEGPNSMVGVLVGEGPGHDEVRAGRPFVGKTGEKLNEELKAVGLARSKLYIINATACYPTSKTPTAMRKAIECCSPAFDAQIQKVPTGTPILAMGAGAVRALGLSVKVGNGRGFIRSKAWKKSPVIVTWHPTYAFFRKASEHGAFSIDLNRFARLTRREIDLKKPRVNIRPTAIDLRNLARDSKILGCDIETGPATLDAPYTGKDPLRARLKTIAFADHVRAISFVWGQDWMLDQAAKEILADPKIVKVFHNGFYFDIPVLKRHGAEVVNVEDTRDLRRSLSSTSRVSLRLLASLYMDFHPWKESDDEDAEKMAFTEKTDDLLKYNGWDAYVTRACFGYMLKEMQNEDDQDQEEHQEDTGQGEQARKGQADGGQGDDDAQGLQVRNHRRGVGQEVRG